MSRELRATLRVDLDQGSRPKRTLNRQQFITTTGNNHMTGEIYAVPNTATTIALPVGMGTPQAMYVENMDDTNSISIGATSVFSTSLTPIKLFPKDSTSGINFGWIPWQGPRVTASAGGATPDLYIEIYEL